MDNASKHPGAIFTREVRTMTPKEMLDLVVAAMSSPDPEQWPDNDKLAIIAAIAQADAAARQAVAMERIAKELEQIGSTMAHMVDDMPLQVNVR